MSITVPAEVRVRRSAGLVDAAYHLPGPALDIATWGPQVGVDAGLVERLQANGCRHFHAADAQTDADLAAAALDRLLQQRDLDPARIGILVHAHSQNFSVPAAPQSLLADLAERCHLKPNVAVSVGELACAGIVKALEVALRLLQHDAQSDYAVVVSSDRVFGGPAYRVRQECGIQSDAGAAILLGRTGVRAQVADLVVRQYPGLAAGPGTPEVDRRLGMLPWSHTRRALLELQQRGLDLAALGGLYPTNADGPYWQRLATTMGLPPQIVFLRNMRERGHACSCDLAINLVDAGFDALSQGQRILCFSQSNVGAYGAVVLENAS